jgi:hypothetical protein
MSAPGGDLLDSSQPYSRYGTSRRTDASSRPEEPLPGPRQVNLPYHTRTNSDRYLSSDFDESEELNSTSRRTSSIFKQPSTITSDSANSEGFPDTADLADLAEGQRLVIAIDYGTTFTGTKTRKCASETDTDTH